MVFYSAALPICRNLKYVCVKYIYYKTNLIFFNKIILNSHILLIFLKGLFNLMHSTSETKTEIYIRQASPESYRQVLRAIRQKEIYKIIVDTNPDFIKQFFRSVCIMIKFEYFLDIILHFDINSILYYYSS